MSDKLSRAVNQVPPNYKMPECPDINDWWRNWLTEEERQKFVSGEWKLYPKNEDGGCERFSE